MNSVIPDIDARNPKISPGEYRRYGRHLIIPEVGLKGQRRLKAARVLVIGTGGLGSPSSLYLAAAGVGTIGLVDFDVIDETICIDRYFTPTKMWVNQRFRLQRQNSPKQIRIQTSRYMKNC
jgi:molybdopterin/thiamine biosynthesis adenylyltransferase